MKQCDIDRLFSDYSVRFGASRRLYDLGKQYFPNGVSQASRDCEPFPLFVSSATGSKVRTEDGHILTDFWQGHFSNILGHNPTTVTEAIRGSDGRPVLQLGLNTRLEQELATRLCSATAAEQCIFCSTGAQATMLATLIGLARTGRRLVVKTQGGWHGVQPWSSKDVNSFPPRQANEFAGLSGSIADNVITIPFNCPRSVENVFKQYGESIGVFITELVLGNSGMEMADLEFVKTVRRCCTEYSAVLVFDEIVTGFRVHYGPLSLFYGVSPDLATYGKVISGGMPFAAITGSRESMSPVRKTNQLRVPADVGTFTSHPSALRASIAMLDYLSSNAKQVYTVINENAFHLRQSLRRLFESNGMPAEVTGSSSNRQVPDFPIMTVRPQSTIPQPSARSPNCHWDSNYNDIRLRDCYTRVALANRGFFTWQGAGALTAAHTLAEIDSLVEAYTDWIGEWQ